MKYALVNTIKTEASKGIKGVCPVCGAELIAKCGELKIHHWAHKGTRSCDLWWETETEWHRNWKNMFPVDWQEKVFIDERTREKHIADVFTDDGLVIEFQHSHINPIERSSREQFYRNLVWVVDGTRLKHDFPRFIKGKGSFRLKEKDIYKVYNPDECISKAWLDSKVPVIFDFLIRGISNEANEIDRNFLYCLFPVKIENSVVVAKFTRGAFLNSILNKLWIDKSNNYINDLIREKKEQQEIMKKMEAQKALAAFQLFLAKGKYRSSRRF